MQDPDLRDAAGMLQQALNAETVEEEEQRWTEVGGDGLLGLLGTCKEQLSRGQMALESAGVLLESVLPSPVSPPPPPPHTHTHSPGDTWPAGAAGQQGRHGGQVDVGACWCTCKGHFDVSVAGTHLWCGDGMKK